MRFEVGWVGVDIFFVLSGFLINGILYDTRETLHRVRNFYVRRTLRIFPLYYGLFALLLFCYPFVHWRWNAYWLAWPLYVGNFLRFVSPAATQWRSPLEYSADGHLTSQLFPRSEIYLGHLWSLCVEEQFYLFWPFVVFFVRDRRKLIVLCTGAVIAGPLLRLLLQARAPGWMVNNELLYRFTPAQLDALLLGGLVALLWRGPARGHLVRVAGIVAVLGSVTLAAYMVLVVHGWRLLPGTYPRWSFTGGLEFVDLYSAALIVCALLPGGLVFRLLSRRPMRWLGRLTYGAYVFHDLPHDLYVHIVAHSGLPQLARGGATQEAATAALAFSATIVLAWLSLRFFEAPFLNLKERWTVRSDARG